MKKLLSLLLTAALVMAAVCSGISVSAAETHEELASSGGEMELASSGGGVELLVCGDYEYYLSDDGTATVSSYLGSDTEVEVPCELDGIPVTALSWAFESNETITSVVIPAGVAEIGSGTFRECTALTSVSIPDTVTTIGWAAFQKCESLSEINIPDSVYHIGSSAFDKTLWYENQPDGVIYAGKVAYKMRNSSITSLALPEGTVGIAEDAFSYKNITSVQIPASVRYIARGAFGGSSGIVSIDVNANNPYYNSANDCNAIIETETGTLIASSRNTFIPDTVHIIASDAFSNSRLESIEIPSSVTLIECNAFFAAGAITSITIPSSVVKIGYDAFAYCRSLVEINGAEGVKDFESGVFRDTQWWDDQPDGLVYVGNTAYRFKGDGCPAALTLENGTISIAGDAFSDCETLESVTLPDSLLTIGGSAFSGCSSLTEINFGSNLERIGDSAFQRCSSLTEITLPDTLKEIGYYVFDTCESLENAVIPGSVKEMGWGIFYGCTALKNVTLCEGLVIIPGATFNDCSALQSVVLPSTVETIESYAFYNCSSLSEVTLPDALTQIGMEAFYGCESLTSVVLPDRVTTVSSAAFKNCGTLEAVTIPASVEKLSKGAFEGTKVKDLYLFDMSTFWQFIYSDEDFKFENLCLNGEPVTSLVIPDTFTEIEDSAFSGWEGIVSVQIPDTVENIGDSAFLGCSGLTEIVIPDFVTTIGSSAFSECSSMERAFISKGVSQIGRSAFSNCGSLKELTVDEENPIFDSRDNCNAVIETATNKLIHGCGTTHIPKTVTCIGRSAFNTCLSLRSIVIPDSVKEIETDAFILCANLRQITLPASVQSVGDDAFLGCTSLKSYAVENSEMTIGHRAFGYYTYYESWWEGNTLHIELREGVYSGITVYGFMNSTAHLYAVNNQMTFALWDRRPEDSTEPPTEPETITYILGDADGDGSVTILDATQIQKKLASLPIVSTFNERAAEVDRDGSISILDATQIQKHLAHLPSNEAIGTQITETV